MDVPKCYEDELFLVYGIVIFVYSMRMKLLYIEKFN